VRHRTDFWALSRGRNVCIYFLLGNCKFGGVACVYCHDKTYLPLADHWWEDEEKRAQICQITDCLGPGERPVFLGHMFKTEYRIPWRIPGLKEEFGPRQVEVETFDKAAEVTGMLVGRTNRGAGSPRPRRGRRGGGRRRDRGKGRGERRKGRDIDLDYGSDVEVEERMANFGFTEDDVMELLCQGVKPWDDDAWVSVLLHCVPSPCF